VKGAPEEIIKISTQVLTKDVKPQKMTSNMRSQIEDEIVNANMARKGQKVLSFAFKEVRLEDIQVLSQRHDIESPEFRKKVESELIYLGTFGLEDPIRESVL